LNSNKAKESLDWQQILEINETLKLTFEWYKNFYSKGDIINITNQQIKLFFNK